MEKTLKRISVDSPQIVSDFYWRKTTLRPRSLFGTAVAIL